MGARRVAGSGEVALEAAMATCMVTGPEADGGALAAPGRSQCSELQYSVFNVFFLLAYCWLITNSGMVIIVFVIRGFSQKRSVEFFLLK
jgi:hypothetical protein